MRLIDADALIDKWEHDIGIFFARDIVTSIDNAPTIDAVPVRHGEWERFDKTKVRCSVCGAIFGNCVVGLFNYCSECGAQMDGERRDG